MSLGALYHAAVLNLNAEASASSVMSTGAREEMYLGRSRRIAERVASRDANRARKRSARGEAARFLFTIGLLLFFLLLAVTLLLAVRLRGEALMSYAWNVDRLFGDMAALRKAAGDGEISQLYALLREAGSPVSPTAGTTEGSHTVDIDSKSYAALYPYGGGGTPAAETCSALWVTRGKNLLFCPLPEDFPHENEVQPEDLTQATITGWMDEKGIFHLTKMEANYYRSIDHGSYTTWGKTLYDTPETDADTVTLKVSSGLRFTFYQSDGPLHVGRRHFDSLQAYADSIGIMLSQYDGLGSLLPAYSNSGLGTLVYQFRQPLTLPNGDLYWLVYVACCSPLKLAVRELRWLYLLSISLLGFVSLLYLEKQKRYLTDPLRRIRIATESTEEELPDPWEEPMWTDAARLAYVAAEMRGTIMQQKNEITRLKTALDYAENAEKERRRMLSDMAHELKTPLAVLHGYAEGLQERINEEKRDEYAEIILKEAERMDGMVMELLELSRLEAGKVVLATDSFDLGTLTAEVVRTLARSIEEKGQRPSLSVEGDCTLQADEARIRQAITNLLSNAVKYGAEGSEIRVRLDREGKHLRFSVQNDCEPLTEEQLSRVWESFYRVDPARHDKGTGLGLPIVKGIVELHGGTVFSHSIANGVEFGFVI